MAHYIGLDLGGTNIKAGVIDEFGRPLATLSAPTHADEGPKAVLAALADAARSVAKQYGLTLDQVNAIGVGAPGPIDFDAGVVLAAPNLPGWTNVPLQKSIAQATGRPVVIENDANAAAMGEFWAGAGQDPTIRDLVMLTLGTGVGGGVIIDGHVYHGGFGFAPEIGHMIMVVNGEPCGCGQHGCLESYASATATIRRAIQAIQVGEATSLRALYEKNSHELSAKDVFDAAKAGDTVAQRVVDQTVTYLGVACASICRLYDPQMIVFAGGMILAGDFLFDHVRAVFKQQNWKLLPARVQIVPAQLGNDAGIIGAAAVAWDRDQSGEL
jgi:glucokinase